MVCGAVNLGFYFPRKGGVGVAVRYGNRSISHTNPTTNATVTARPSHLTLRERLCQLAVM